MKELGLDDISWWTSDVHSLMKSLHLTQLDNLSVSCKLKHSPPSVSPTSRVKVDEIWIAVSLSINTLMALLSDIEVNKLGFKEKCQVLEMSSYSPPLRQVCHYEQHKLYQKYIIFLVVLNAL